MVILISKDLFKKKIVVENLWHWRQGYLINWKKKKNIYIKVEPKTDEQTFQGSWLV